MNAPRALLVAGVVLIGWSAGILIRRTGPPPAAATRTAARERASVLRFDRGAEPLPRFTARDLDGRPVASSSFRGKVTILNFWATWCPPCRAEIPDLVALQDKYRDHLQIVGVSEDDGGADVVRRFAAEHRMNYTILMATPDLERLFPAVDALPTSYVLDREGRVVKTHVGMLSPATTELEVRALAGLPVDVPVEWTDREQQVAVR